MLVVDNAFFRSGLHELFGCIFTVLMATAAVSDIRTRRITNGLVLTTLSVGTAFVLFSMGPKQGISSGLEGALVGLAVWTPMWAFKKIGAGDVKFFSASSVWIGPALALKASFLTAVFGGALALVWLLVRARSSRADTPLIHPARLGPVENVDFENFGTGEPTQRMTLPYGVAMAAGLTLTAWFPHLLYG